MNEGPTRVTYYFKWARRRRLLVGLLFSMLLVAALTACGGEDPAAQVEVPPAETLAENQLRLVCNDSCAERAQCGTSTDGLLVVFMKRNSPDVNNHDLAIHAGAIGTIVGTQAGQVVETATGNQFTTTFYNLLLSDQVTQAWVAEWCVSR